MDQDFSQMSDDQLLEMYQQLKAEEVDDGRKVMATKALELQNEQTTALNAASGTGEKLLRAQDQLKQNKLNLGPVRNFVQDVQNNFGMSSPESRNYATFKADIKTMVNDALLLNKGVQTEGDAKRAAAAILNNLNDEGVVSAQIARLNELSKEAVRLRKVQINQLRKDVKQPAMDTSVYEYGGKEMATRGMSPQQVKTRRQFSGATGDPGTRQNPYVPKTRAEYENLPQGAHYIASNGQIATRNKAQKAKGDTAGYKVIAVEE